MNKSTKFVIDSAIRGLDSEIKFLTEDLDRAREVVTAREQRLQQASAQRAELLNSLQEAEGNN